MRTELREEGRPDSVMEREGLRVSDVQSEVAAKPGTVSWPQAGKYTLRGCLVGIASLGFVHYFSGHEGWSSNPGLLIFFVVVATKSGYDYDWRSRFRIFCSSATIAAVLGLFSQWVSGLPVAEAKHWIVLVPLIDLPTWWIYDWWRARKAKR